MNCQSPGDCAVSGSLGAVLRMSRAAGVAPLQFRRLRNGWHARVSYAANVYGQVFAVTLCVLALFAFVTDFYIAQVTPVKPGIRIKRIVYLIVLTCLTLILLTTAFTGTMRMKNMMVYMNQIHKINRELSSYGCTPSDDKKCWLLVILSMAGGTLTIATDYGELMYFSIYKSNRVLISATYLFYFLLYMVLMIIQIQFALLVVAALSPLKQLNGCLDNLLQEINSPANTRHVSQKKLKINNFILPDVTTPSTIRRRNIPEAIRHLAYLHSCICDVVRLVDLSHGPVLLTLLPSYFLHLVISLYFILNIFITDTGPFFYSLVIQSLWGSFHFCGLIIVVEPCHQTQEEMANTMDIVSQMAPKDLSASDPLSFELDLFYRHLVLNQVTYTPLKMFTVNRALIVTMLSVIATYLVVVIQF